MIILNAQVEGLSTRADRTVKIVIGTQENVKAAELFALQGQLVSIGISTNELKPEEIELLKDSKFEIDDIPDSKSPSQRLRNVLYRLWEQADGGYSDFNLYYLNKMETIINHYKDKLT
jgi:hypothetical protein